MLLHNLYWLTKINQTEFNINYVDHKTLDQTISITPGNKYVFARNSVKLNVGFNVSGTEDFKFII